MNFQNAANYEKLFPIVAKQCSDKNYIALWCLDKPRRGYKVSDYSRN